MEDKERFNKNVGIILKNARDVNKLTLSEVASKTKRAISTISDNERGLNDIPFSVIVDYCKLYNIDINELIKEASK